MMGQGNNRMAKAKKEILYALPIIIIIGFTQLVKWKKRRRLILEEAGAGDLLER